MRDSINAAIAGATGYIGLELIKILSRHPKTNITYLCAQKSLGKKISIFDNKIKSKKLPKVSKIEHINWKKVDIIFTALPNGEAYKIAQIKPTNVKLIDLSADFRLDSFDLYNKWYGINFKSNSLLKKSIYSLTEFSRHKIKNFNIIACPGCYPTSIQLPLFPLIEKKMINHKNIIIDSKSGYSGAGKNIKKRFKYKNLFNSVAAYGVGSHRHTAEIDQELSKAGKREISVFFTPHLIPMYRGILSTIYLEPSKSKSAKEIHIFLKKYHKKNHFVKVVDFGKTINTGSVINTNFCEISVCPSRNKKKIIIISTIDNLIKGGSGQAVQNMNIMCNFKETLGLV